MACATTPPDNEILERNTIREKKEKKYQGCKVWHEVCNYHPKRDKGANQKAYFRGRRWVTRNNDPSITNTTRTMQRLCYKVCKGF